MKKIRKIINAFQLLIAQPSLINLVLNSEEKWTKTLLKKHPKTPQLPTVDLNAFGVEFEKELALFSFLGGGSLPTDILLLKTMCKKFKDCSYFEIGTWRGESVINVAEIAKKCYTLNLSKKDILALNLPEEYANLHGFFSKEKDNITHLFGDSLFYNFEKLNQKFDVIFIDGNHEYTYVKNDTEKVFKHLVHENSIVIWHDYAYDPEKRRPEVLLGILDGIPKAKNENLYHVSNTLCAIYINEKLEATLLKSPVKPQKTFQITIKTND